MSEYHTTWTLHKHDKTKPVVNLNLFSDPNGLRIMLDQYGSDNHYGLHITDKGSSCRVSEMCMIDGSTSDNRILDVPITFAMLMSLGIEDVRELRERLRIIDRVFRDREQTERK